MSSVKVTLPLDAHMARCDNCLLLVDADELALVEDLFERVEAGGEMPAGECPKCGALAYLADDVVSSDINPKEDDPIH